MHKIIVGTPRSGTSFVTNWYVNEWPQCTALGAEHLWEYFDPLWFNYGQGVGVARPDWPNIQMAYADKETKKRISGLPSDYIFKMHSGPDMSKYIWDFVYQKPIVLVKRKDLLGQFISYGIGWTTFKWYWYPHAGWNPKWKNDVVLLKTKCINGLEKGQTFNYKKVWFDDLVWRIEDLEKCENKLNIERTVWFEDLPNWPKNGEQLMRQNPQSNDEKLNLLKNKNEFLGWFKEWAESNCIYGKY